MTREGMAFVGYFLLVSLLLLTQVTGAPAPSALTVLKPLQAGISGVQTVRQDLVSWFTDRRSMRDRLESLQRVEQRNRRLESRLRRLDRTNQQLRDQLDLVEPAERDFTLVEVVQQDLGPWQNQVRVALPDGHGVESGTAVLVFQEERAFLWGVVESVSSRHARILGVRDPRFRIGVTLEGLEDRHWVVSGDGDGGLSIEPFPVYLEVDPGTEVKTSTASSLVAEPWVVGWVRRRNPESGSAGNVSLNVEPAVPSSVEFLWLPTDDL